MGVLKKFLVSLSLVSLGFSQSGNVQVGNTNVNVIDFDANKISNALQNKFEQGVQDIINQITGQLPPGISGKLSNLLSQIFHGLVCPHLDLPHISQSVKIPSTITIALPCGQASLDLSPEI